MSRRSQTPLAFLARGVIAGAVGTAAMTGWQSLAAKLQGSEESDSGAEQPPQDPWAKAPAPAKVAKRVSEGVFHQPVSSELIPLLTNVMHWAYGTGWGALYGLAAAGRPRAIRRGVLFGSVVWASSYLELVPMGIYKPPWEYEPQEVALDLSYHLAYGLGTAIAFDALQP